MRIGSGGELCFSEDLPGSGVGSDDVCYAG